MHHKFYFTNKYYWSGNFEYLIYKCENCKTKIYQSINNKQFYWMINSLLWMKEDKDHEFSCSEMQIKNLLE